MLKDKVAIITGGSMGVGKIIATAFARESAAVMLMARNKPELEATRRELAGITTKVAMYSGDVTKEEEVKELVRRTLAEFGTIDILVNSAGILGPLGIITDITSEDWVRTININLIGTFLCIKAVLPTMIKNRRGKIITFGGGGSDTPRPRFSAYSASKTAVIRLTETIAAEVKEYNIDVNAIAPGPVDTRMLSQRLASLDIIGKEEAANALRHQAGGCTPPEKVMEIAVFLASAKSDGLSGKEISLMTDNWQNIPQHLSEIMSSDVYTLRRIAPKERGYNW